VLANREDAKRVNEANVVALQTLDEKNRLPESHLTAYKGKGFGETLMAAMVDESR